VDLNRGLEDLVAVALVAALAPLVVAALPGPRIPQVVIFLLGGVVIGPHVLGLAETSNIQLLANIGLGALADIGQQDGVMLPATAAALVGAGVLSVLVYPQIAVGLHRSAPLTPADAGIATAQAATSSSPPPETPGPHGHDG
jgi:hypothetical protein